MQIIERADGFDPVIADQLILAHRSCEPALFVGRGEERIEMHRGNVDIEDDVSARAFR